jgi:uncharacterized membrane protein YphA (DoxX/SURF4 family)
MNGAGMNKFFSWILRIIPAAIMFQTLYFKFTAHPQSVKLFTILGMEPQGRIAIGILELIAGILLLINRSALPGAILGAGLMCGALFFHLTNSSIGIYFDGDPLLFIYALVTLACCAAVVIINKKQIPGLLKLKF